VTEGDEDKASSTVTREKAGISCTSPKDDKTHLHLGTLFRVGAHLGEVRQDTPRHAQPIERLRQSSGVVFNERLCEVVIEATNALVSQHEGPSVERCDVVHVQIDVVVLKLCTME
jgi:hypothetical protein